VGPLGTPIIKRASATNGSKNYAGPCCPKI